MRCDEMRWESWDDVDELTLRERERGRGRIRTLVQQGYDVILNRSGRVLSLSSSFLITHIFKYKIDVHLSRTQSNIHLTISSNVEKKLYESRTSLATPKIPTIFPFSPTAYIRLTYGRPRRAKHLARSPSLSPDPTLCALRSYLHLVLLSLQPYQPHPFS